jgi:hypothetical protein
LPRCGSPTLAGLVTCGGPDSSFTVEDFAERGDKIWARMRARMRAWVRAGVRARVRARGTANERERWDTR